MKKNTILTILGVIIIIGALLFFGQSDVVQNENTTQNVNSKRLVAGDTFPEFSLVDVDSKIITRDSFNDKPTIIWFTTSWCVPCQIGARDTAKLDNELGGNAFDVFVLFIDPRESNEDLINWRNSYANTDWPVAFDDQNNSLAQKLDVKFLDTKYLLDENGVIVNIDEKQVNSKYIELIRQTVNK